MRFKSLETTPNPNSMKLNFHDSFGKPVTYSLDNASDGPDFVQELLSIEGLSSVFVCNDFITLIRIPNKDWKAILDEASRIFHLSEDEPIVLSVKEGDSLQEVQAQVFVQTFKGIPIQVKVVGAGSESRLALEPRFNDACMYVQEQSGADFLKERFWDERGIRYGFLDEIAKEVADEINGLIDVEKLEHLKKVGLDQSQAMGADSKKVDLSDKLADPDWHIRLGAVQALAESNASVEVLAKLARDEHPQVRRLVAAALGMTEDVKSLPVLCDMLLNDNSVGVRRTAGDALSDIGDPNAEPEVVKALGDSNKLVRWRAARYLNEVGTEQSIPFLEKALDEPEYEVKLEVQAAISRIKEGKDGSIPVWKQMIKKD